MKTIVRSRTYLDAASGRQCVNCGGEHGVVAAHSNLGEHGKGGAQKAHDIMVAWLCFACHTWYDTDAKYMDPTGLWTPREKRDFILTMIARTIIAACQKGVIRLDRK